MNKSRLAGLRESTAARARNLDRAIFGEYARTIEAILAEESAGRIDRTTAAALRALFRDRFSSFVERANRLTVEDVNLTIDNVTAQWQSTVGGLLLRRGVKVAIDWKKVGPETMRIMARTRGAAEFRSLLKYRLQKKVIPQLDSIIDTAIARGTAAEELKRQVARVLVSQDTRVTSILTKASKAAVADAGELLRAPNFAKNLLFDARRIGISEINNALRESNRAAAEETGIIAAMHWQTSGRHDGLDSSPDECDDIAEADEYGYGPGMYPPEAWPEAPHPLCGCYQGDVIYKAQDEWT